MGNRYPEQAWVAGQLEMSTHLPEWQNNIPHSRPIVLIWQCIPKEVKVTWMYYRVEKAQIEMKWSVMRTEVVMWELK